MSPDDRPWRCFVAVPIDDELRTAVATTVRELRAAPGADDWRWTDAEGWHVTLAFLGAMDPASVPAHAAALSAVADAQAAFTLAAGGLGAFPGPRHARVLWYGVADTRGELRRLARAAAQAVGLPDEGRFRGHLTLARARERLGTDASALLAGATPRMSQLVVDRVVLFRSHLGRGPATYEALATAPLVGDSA
jgi:2'-5' RNA ligase